MFNFFKNTIFGYYSQYVLINLSLGAFQNQFSFNRIYTLIHDHYIFYFNQIREMFNVWLSCITNFMFKTQFLTTMTYMFCNIFNIIFIFKNVHIIDIYLNIHCFESLSFPIIYVYKCSSLSFKTWLFIILWLTKFYQYWLVHIMEHLNNFGLSFEQILILLVLLCFWASRCFKCCLICDMDKSKCGYWYIMLMQFLMDSMWGMFFFIFNSVSFNSKFPFIFNLIILTMSLHTSWLEIVGTSIILLH